MQSRNVSKSSAPMSGSCSRREGGSSRTGDHSSRKDDFASTKRMAPEELHLNGSGVYCNGHLYDVDTLMGSRDELGRVLQELKHESLRAHEAEERAELLAEDNERLRSKATMLSAATGNSAEDLETTTVTELRNQVTALHAHVDDLTQQLETAATEAQRKEERIRLLERKLADQLLRDDLAGSPYYSRDGSPSNDFHASPRASTGDSLAAHAMDAAPAASKSAVSPRHVLPNHTVDAGTRISADVAPARSSVTPPRGHTSVSPSRITPTPIRLGGRQPAQRKASVPRRSPSALRTMSSTTTTAVVAPTSAAPPPRVKPLSLNGSMLLSQQRSYASLDHPTSGRRSGSLVATPVSRVPVQRSSSTVTSGAGRFERDAQRPRSLAARPSSPRVQTEVSERRSASAQPRSSTTASSPRSTRERLYASPTAASSAKMRSSSVSHRTAPLQPTASTSTVSPSRSISAMRPSRRPRPQISYNPRNQLSTLKGTTTTVVFRSAKRASREESFQAEPSMAAQ